MPSFLIEIPDQSLFDRICKAVVSVNNIDIGDTKPEEFAKEMIIKSLTDTLTRFETGSLIVKITEETQASIAEEITTEGAVIATVVDSTPIEDTKTKG